MQENVRLWWSFVTDTRRSCLAGKRGEMRVCDLLCVAYTGPVYRGKMYICDLLWKTMSYSPLSVWRGMNICNLLWMRYVDRGIATRRQKIQCYFHFMQKIFHTQLLSGNSGYAAKMLKIFSALPGRGGYAGFPDPAYLLPKPPPTPLHAIFPGNSNHSVFKLHMCYALTPTSSE